MGIEHERKCDIKGTIYRIELYDPKAKANASNDYTLNCVKEMKPCGES